MLLILQRRSAFRSWQFQQAPTLGGECYSPRWGLGVVVFIMFQQAPTLGGECYERIRKLLQRMGVDPFQQAPTLGGECYAQPTAGIALSTSGFNGHPPLGVNATHDVAPQEVARALFPFQRAPTLGGECYGSGFSRLYFTWAGESFNGHPPLGVNATDQCAVPCAADSNMFQRAPTLGGECYSASDQVSPELVSDVSTGTHPWG